MNCLQSQLYWQIHWWINEIDSVRKMAKNAIHKTNYRTRSHRGRGRAASKISRQKLTFNAIASKNQTTKINQPNTVINKYKWNKIRRKEHQMLSRTGFGAFIEFPWARTCTKIYCLYSNINLKCEREKGRKNTSNLYALATFTHWCFSFLINDLNGGSKLRIAHGTISKMLR